MADGDRVTVGLDVGSSSTKVVAVDESGHIVRRVVRPSGTIVTADGRAEHDASIRWWDEPADALRETTKGVCDRIDAVAVSGIGPCVLLTNANCTPRVDHEIEPTHHSIYDEHYASCRELYESTRPIVHQLSGTRR